MPEYRRSFVPGGTFFFTQVTEGRAGFLCEAGARQILRQSLVSARERWPFRTDAMVLLPDHWHAVWSLPEGDTGYSKRIAYAKKEFTKGWLAVGGVEQAVSTSRQRNRRRGVWQRRFWEYTIRDEEDWRRHCEYIHYNPVKHGLVTCPHAWPYSTFHRWVREGWVEADWGCTCNGRARPPLSFEDIERNCGE
jgi:REP-associated tyrosine transposase